MELATEKKIFLKADYIWSVSLYFTGVAAFLCIVLYDVSPLVQKGLWILSVVGLIVAIVSMRVTLVLEEKNNFKTPKTKKPSA